VLKKICGVSAAIAGTGAIRGDAKKLSYVVSLVLIVAVPMIIVMPLQARLAGAWIGGTIDTTARWLLPAPCMGKKP
jgi:uncharacterized membrane protein YadS